MNEYSQKWSDASLDEWERQVDEEIRHYLATACPLEDLPGPPGAVELYQAEQARLKESGLSADAQVSFARTPRSV